MRVVSLEHRWRGYWGSFIININYTISYGMLNYKVNTVKLANAFWTVEIELSNYRIIF